ncbi:MAG: hypothetical protein V4709_12645 [Pseudomonadota bacterium]
MSAFKKNVGPAVARWNEDTPLQWTMTEQIAVGTEADGRRRSEPRTFTFDLTALEAGYDVNFLLSFKEMLIERRMRVSVSSVNQDARNIVLLLKKCHQTAVGKNQKQHRKIPLFNRVDGEFLKILWAIQDDIPVGYLRSFKSTFVREKANHALFAEGLVEADFPTGRLRLDVPPHPSDHEKSSACSEHVGMVGRLRKRVLQSALSRAVLIQILNITEIAFANGTLSLGVYAYFRLLLNRVARPESARLLRCKDLRISVENGKTEYYLDMSIPKSRCATRPVVAVRIHNEVGRLLDAQRSAVIDRYAPLVDKRNKSLTAKGSADRVGVGDLPLFPAGGKRSMPEGSQARLGFMSDCNHVRCLYLKPLKTLTEVNFSHNRMRHTLGTQLALTGCSASTIAAILLHANDNTAQVYVDLFFDGSINELSDSLIPDFLKHFPVFESFVSVDDPIQVERRITSEDPDKLSVDVTGACADLVCSYAPITCYDCPRFIPAYDADHSVNLRVVEQEIRVAEKGGLARQREAKQYKYIANRIRYVITLSELMKTTARAERETVADVR